MDELIFLTSSRGEKLLHELAQVDLDADLIKRVTTLRREYDAEQVNAAMTQARLRRKAVEKFGMDAARMFFTADALEQASDPLIRAYRADIVQGTEVLDLCCGIGADALAFGRTNLQVTGVDYDQTRIAFARQNAEVLGLSNVLFEVADVRELEASAEVVFFDPARRDERGKRIHNVWGYIPNLGTITRFQAGRRMVKIAPGVDLAQLKDFPCRVEFISVGGDLKEALLHVDESGMTATYMDAELRLQWSQADTATEPEITLSAPRGWLIEPDFALMRAGLVRHFAGQIGGYLLDETIAYITADAKPDTAWGRAWRIWDWMPFNLKNLREYLRVRNIGRVTVKKRGSAITPEDLMSKLRLKGAESCTLVLTRYATQHIVIICADYTA